MVTAILLFICLILVIIYMIIEIVRAIWHWKKENSRIRREEDLLLCMKRVTIDELRKQYGLPPMELHEFNDPKDFEWPPVVKEEE